MTALPRFRPLCAALLLALTAGAAQAADLMQAYELARQSDPQLQGADASRLANREGVPQARSSLLPQIDGSASLDRTRVDSDGGTVVLDDGTVISGGESESTSRSYGVTLRQSIYDRRNYTRLAAARSRAAQADATYDAANDNLIIRTAEAYFNALTAIDSLAFARAEERAVKRQLDQADQRFEVGLTAITDVHEARARYDSSRANAIAAEVQLDDAREALTEITGQAMTNLQGLDENFAPSQPVPDDINRWVETALAENPSLLAQEYAVQAANDDIATARAGHLPTLSAGASWGKNASWLNDRVITDDPTDALDNGRTSKSIGLTLNVPIFSGGLVSSQVRQSIYTRDYNEEVLDQQRRAITRSTRNAFRSLLAGISEIEARRQALVSAQSALEATEAGFEVGTRTIVDVLISQQTLFQAQSGYSTSRHNFLVNTLRLKQAAGTIAIQDVQDVNRNLVRDAEAALDLPPSEDGSAVTPDGESRIQPVEPVDIEPVPQVEN